MHNSRYVRRLSFGSEVCSITPCSFCSLMAGHSGAPCSVGKQQKHTWGLVEAQLFAPLLPTGFDDGGSNFSCYSTSHLLNTWCANKMHKFCTFTRINEIEITFPFVLFRSQEEQTRDVVVPGCFKDNSHLLKVAESSGAPGAHTVPRHNTAVQMVNSIHVVEVYSHKDSYNKPTCKIPG